MIGGRINSGFCISIYTILIVVGTESLIYSISPIIAGFIIGSLN